MSTPPIGTLSAAHRYPVKSMAGESLLVARVLADHGVHGDRVFAVLDRETGRIASAKHPRRWGALLDCQARFVDDLEGDRRRAPVTITLPDRATVASDHADVDRTLSIAFGRPGDPVRLTGRSSRSRAAAFVHAVKRAVRRR